MSISYLWGNDSIRNYDLLFNYVSFSMLPISYKRKYMMIGLNLGFALGLNYNFSKSITLSIESGFRGGFGIDLLKKRKSYDSSSDIDTTPSGEFEGYEGYLSLGVLYRIKESIE
ncbi:MAG: hypothetical protein E4G96_09195 [Chrysiogenales bacterium]|nr:MAG: hypothetical protein E4G96_09195 [Chrysiogenales bacterium]